MRGLYALVALIARASAGYEPAPMGCGEYEIAGKIVLAGKEFELVVFEGSQNEYRLRIEGKDPFVALAQVGRTVKAKAQLSVAVKNYRGTVLLRDANERIPDLLRLGEAEGFRLLKKKNCD